jgi:hypothetical protein
VGRAKDLIVKPISASDANRIVRALHYSGKVVNNSQLHLGVFLDGKCGGAMQFGPSLDKRKMLGLVSGTLWNEFIELNRMAFADWLPRNSESRAIGYAFRWMRKQYPQIKWCVSFADGTQCGDGTIYRASGFVLTQINKNKSLIKFPGGEVVAQMSISATGLGENSYIRGIAKKYGVRMTGGASLSGFIAAGAELIPGFQLRYIYFLNKDAKARLVPPILPFSAIDEMGAGMYKGESIKRDKQAFTESIGVAAGQNRPSRSTIPDGAQSCP